MDKYIKRLIQLVEFERNEEVKIMEWEMKNLTGPQREKKGRAVLDLTPKIIGEELGMYLIKFGRKKVIDTEISVGDEVIISKNDPTKSDIKGIVVEKGTRFITISTNNLLPKSFKKVRLDLYASDITYKRQIENLENLNKNGKKVLTYILETRILSDNGIEKFKEVDKKLNKFQKLTISKALRSKDFFLIHGPFGTGKTRTLVEYIIQEVKRGKKVLVTADSNLAVDNLIERLENKVSHVRLGHPSRISKNLKKSSLIFQIQTHERYKNIEKLKYEFEKLLEKRETFQKPIPKWKRGLNDNQILKLAKNNKTQRGIPLKVIKDMAEWIKLNNKIEEIKEKISKVEEEIANEIIENSQVVFSTNSSSYILDKYNFDVVVVDEATQSTIPSILIPLSKGEKFILAGDHKQLPPTILSNKAKELSITLFEKLIEKYPKRSEVLKIQYRMNEKLMEFPNREFYNNILISHVKNITLKDLAFSGKDIITNPSSILIFIDTSNVEHFEKQKKDSSSYFNEFEAQIVKHIVEKFLKEGADKNWIGIISPYDDQVELIRSYNLDIDINTVDGFQGREKEVIIISFVRSNKRKEIGFLSDLRRLNVALTRAKRKLILIGNSSTLEINPTYKRLIEFIKENDGGIKWLKASSLI
ncbi:ATPase AAA [Thermosipho sp. 1063]|uniref:IGHMBP2 family helicase n=1 Tax=unclassified Thermosipho (in: thermotogales) TaxID=2676525 RepID=UPI0009493E92|nr:MULTISPECIES: IGHMBP2 family helicase [unclassified Thermosipho (in: thermotogales)]ANQ53835.1 ATPase AAA [Thermosipho sp. 1070]APT72282.1 ATPase AAA [Thermosipho sp. 1063]OOC43527.1 ATPase AAA [Thermosipho sp. 1074]